MSCFIGTMILRSTRVPDKETGERWEEANETRYGRFITRLPKTEIGERDLDLIGYLANLW